MTREKRFSRDAMKFLGALALLALCAGYAGATPGLQLSVHAEGNADDASGNGNNGTALNGAGYAAGRIGQAFSFDGTNDYVEIPHHASLNPAGAFTLTAWIKPTSATLGTVVGKWGDSGLWANQRAYAMNFNANGSIGFAIATSTNQAAPGATTDPGVAPLNTWTHVALVYDGTSTMRIFVNGALAKTQVNPGLGPVTNSTANLGIGTYLRAPSTPFGAYFAGLIDEVQLYSSALSDNSIAAMAEGLVLSLTAEGNANDVSGTGNNGTAVNGVGYVAGRTGQAFSFDGTDDYIRIPTAPSLNPAGAFTLAAWIKPTSAASGTVVGKWGAQGAYENQRAYGLNFNADGSITFAIATAANQLALSATTSAGVAPLNTWTHVALVYDGSAVRKIYVNGVLDTTRTDVGLGPVTNSIADLVVSGWLLDPTTPWQFFTGSVDEVRLYDSALSDNSVAEMAGLVEVSVPTVTASYNQALTIPVSLNKADGVVSADLSVDYDPQLLTFNTVSSTGTLSNGWSVQSNTGPGTGSLQRVTIAVATGQSSATGAQTLININFTVNNLRHPASSPLTLSGVLLNDGTPPNTTINGSVTLVGNNGSISSVPATIIPRQTIGVTVTDVDENRNSGVAEVRSVQVSNGSQTESLNVTETGVSTGVFTGSISTVFSLASTSTSGSGDNTVQAKAGDRIVFAFADSLDSAGNTVVRKDTTTVIGGKDGRLRVTVVVQPGDTLRVRVTDGDLNTNTGSVETTTVNSVNPRTGESEVLTLTEKSANDSIFFGIAKTTLGSTAGTNNDGVFKAQKGDTLRVTYADTLTAVGGTATVIDRDKVVDPFGDADGNGSVQAFDAARVLFHVLSPFITGIDSLSANVDLLAPFGPITPFDASLILQKRVGLIGRFPVQEDESDNHPQPETDLSTPKPVVAQRLLSLVPGEGYWSVMADERSGILSGDLVLSGIEGKVALAPELQDYLVASRSGESGLRVVFAGAVPVSGSGELLRVYPGVGPGRAQLTRAELNDGQLGVVLSGTAAALKVPTTFALLANYPNPFNPETTIGFALPERSLVTLAVYNALGQQVRMLVSRALPAGQHQVVWDGRDEAGQQVSSGVYMYRLQAGSFSALKRMIMIK